MGRPDVMAGEEDRTGDPVAADGAARLARALAYLTDVGRLFAAGGDERDALRAVAERTVAQGLVRRVSFDLAEDRALIAAGANVPGAPTARWPLATRGRTVGWLDVWTEAAVDSIDAQIFGELATRTAAAIDRARALAREHYVADTLQRALLPDRLPVTERVQFDAAYVPGADEAIVGGDWYDAFRLPDGRIAVSIGDVAGNGLRAAIVMGEIRQAVRAAAFDPRSPSLVLERANTILNMRANPVMVTAAFGIIDLAEMTLVYATAGHPPPVIVLANGIAAPLPGGGIPLGIAEEVETVDWTFSLPPGARCAFVTDGMLEHSRDLVAGEAELLAALQHEVLEPSARPAQSVMRRIFGERGNTDDAAALVIGVDDTAERDFSFAFSAIPAAVRLVRHALDRYALRLGLDDERRFALVTAVGEAMANAVEHAYPAEPGIARVRVKAGDELVVTVEDAGRWRPARKREERGRGLPMMRSLMDHVEIRTGGGSTTIVMTMANYNSARA